jgi:hypothetical protein
MYPRFNVFVAAACAATIVMAAASACAADEVRLSAPVVRDNLAVYFVHGNAGGGVAPLTLEQAQGAIRIHETETHPVMIENLSNQSVFIQLGDLIKGGMQDQVAGTSLLLPPHSGLTALATFCVDPFRSSARDGDDPNLFAATGTLFPSHMARLSILSGASDARAFGKVREQAVWWSIDSMRAQLSQKLGEPLETPRPVHWNLKDDSRANVLLAARRSAWTTSLPLAMESGRLAQAQQPFMTALQRAGAKRDVVGAVFAIDGKVVGADVYQSHALFRAMWAKLLLAYTTEALAAEDPSAAAPPSIHDVSAFLAAAEQGPTRQRVHSEQVRLRDSDAAIYLETAARNGQWTHRSYVAKLDPAAMATAPEALLVRMLETGQVDGRRIATLGEQDNIIVRNDAGGGWSTAIHSPPSAAAQVIDLLQRGNRERQGTGLGILGTVVALMVLLFLAVVVWREVVKPAIRKGITLAAHAGRGLGQFARHVAAQVPAHAREIAQHVVAAWLAMRAAMARSVVPGLQRAYAPAGRMPRLRAAAIS